MLNPQVIFPCFGLIKPQDREGLLSVTHPSLPVAFIKNYFIVLADREVG
jgi:hypothetical protein